MSCSSVAENWHGKPKALGSARSSSTFLSALLPFLKGPQAAMAYDQVFN